MKQRMISITAVLLSLTTLLFAFPITGFLGEDVISAAEAAATLPTTNYAVGDIIEFGSYPQGEVTDSGLINTLNAQPIEMHSCNYYISGTASDYMQYGDVTYGNGKYRKVFFTSYRPYHTIDSSSVNYSYQDDNGYSANTAYWFKYEPIQWRVLDPGSGLVLSEIILDSQPFRKNAYAAEDDTYYADSQHKKYASEYSGSTVRKWLNESFAETAFTKEQSELIKTTTLSNRVDEGYPEKYSNANVKDKVFLLSSEDVRNKAYGFSEFYSEHSHTRRADFSDYSGCQGINEPYGVYYNKAKWILRTACDSGRIGLVYESGGMSDTDVLSTSTGIRPAMCLTLNNENCKISSPEEKKLLDFDVDIHYDKNKGVVSYNFINNSDYDVYDLKLYGFINGEYKTGTVSLTVIRRQSDSTAFSFDVKQKGELDDDEAVTAADARLALRCAVSLEWFSDEKIADSDMDNDGKITASDARYILRTAVSLEKPINSIVPHSVCGITREAAGKDDSVLEKILTAEINGETFVFSVTAYFNNKNSRLVNEVKKYTYEIVPLLPPFNEYFYVKTDNPEPESFRLYDKNTKYDVIYDNGNTIIEPYITLASRRFCDVYYENINTKRVHGGYIFEANGPATEGSNVDGGALTVQAKITNSIVEKYSTAEYWEQKDGYVDICNVNCPALEDKIDYLLNTYTTGAMSFYDKLDAVESGLANIAFYPMATYDRSMIDEHKPYPFLASSPYPELSLNAHYDMFKIFTVFTFSQAIYPYIVDSYGFPNIIWDTAERIEPDCAVERNRELHWLINVTLNGKTELYGGAGNDIGDCIYTDCVDKEYLFDGSAKDIAFSVTKELAAEKIKAHAEKSVKYLKNYISMLEGDIFTETIADGSWIMCRDEFSGNSNIYAYITGDYPYAPYSVEDTWVDGRYINVCNRYQPEAKFDDPEGKAEYVYPTADILIRNVSYPVIVSREWSYNDNRYYYTTKQICSDVAYNYNTETDSWIASDLYSGYYWSEPDKNYVIPDVLELTRAEVTAMDVDRNTDIPPQSGLMYNGTVAPGTPFGH